jgi:hypothetical protein
LLIQSFFRFISRPYPHATYKVNETVFNAWIMKNIAGIFYDLAKASDCVNHELLLSILQFME